MKYTKGKLSPVVYLKEKEGEEDFEELKVLGEVAMLEEEDEEVTSSKKAKDVTVSDRLNLNQLRTFYQLAKSGKLTKAANKLNLTQPALSRQLSLLEASLGERLFFRTSEGLYITQQGRILFRTAARIMEEVAEMRQVMKKSSDKGLRSLRIGTTSVFGAMVLPDIMSDFLRQNRHINFDLVGSNDIFDLKTGEVDILIWPVRLEDENLVVRSLKTYHYGLYASPEYLKEYGEPKSIEDLKNHRLLAASPESPKMGFDSNWYLKILPKNQHLVSPVMLNNTQSISRLGELGHGIMSAPHETVKAHKLNLAPILPEIEGPVIDLNFMHLESLGGFSLVNDLYEEIKQKLNKG